LGSTALPMTFASGAGATTQNIKIPADEIPAADLCNGDQIQLITNSRVDGPNVTTLETTMNVVSLGSADNSKIQSVSHVTQNANGETTTAFQTANIHCNG
jgi:hypothetical protein